GQVRRDELLFPPVKAERDLSRTGRVCGGHRKESDVALVARGDLRGGDGARQADYQPKQRLTGGLHAYSFRAGGTASSEYDSPKEPYCQTSLWGVVAAGSRRQAVGGRQDKGPDRIRPGGEDGGIPVRPSAA